MLQASLTGRTYSHSDCTPQLGILKHTNIAFMLFIAAIMVGASIEVFQTPSVHAQPAGSVTLASSTTTPSSGDPFQRREFVADGRFWYFTVTSGNAGWQSCPTSAPCGSDPAQWTSQSTVHPSVGPGGLSVWYDSSSNLVFYAIGLGSPQFLYRYGTPNSDGTITWRISETGVTTTGSQDDLPYVFASSPNNVWVSVATVQSGASRLELWHYNGIAWAKSTDLVGKGMIGGVVMPLTGVQYGLVTGDVSGSGDNLVIYTTGNGGSTWTSGTTTIDFSLNEAEALGIGSTIYVAGQTPGFVDTFFSCAYPCASPPALTALATGLPNNDVWATLSTDGSSDLIVAYEASQSTVDYIQSANLGASWSSPLALSSNEVLSDSDFSGTAAPLIIGNTAIFGWTDGLASPFATRFAELSLSTRSSTSSSSTSTLSSSTSTSVSTSTTTTATTTIVTSTCTVTFTLSGSSIAGWRATC